MLDKENVKGKKFLRFLMNARQFPSKEYDDDDFISTRFEKTKDLVNNAFISVFLLFFKNNRKNVWKSLFLSLISKINWKKLFADLCSSNNVASDKVKIIDESRKKKKSSTLKWIRALLILEVSLFFFATSIIHLKLLFFVVATCEQQKKLKQKMY